MSYFPKAKEVNERSIEVNTGSYQKIKKLLLEIKDNCEGIELVELVFPKVTLTTKKNIEKLFKENYNLFNWQNNMGNKKILFVTITGDFDDEYVEHNKKRNTILQKANNVNKKYEEYALKNSKSEDLEVKDLQINRTYTSVLNRNLKNLLEQVLMYSEYLYSDGFYHERADLDLNVDFQRDIVWTLEQKQSLIISLIEDLPIGNFYINAINIYQVAKDTGKSLLELSEIDFVLYDGKQRINAILEFMLNEFSITYNGEEYFYGNLDKRTQNKIIDKTVNVYHTEITDKNDLIDFYIKINSNQVAHKKEDFDKALQFKIM